MQKKIVKLTSSLAIILFISLTSNGLNKSHSLVSQKPTKNQKSTNHPLVFSPEETLKVILQAYINRDVETVMAYYPQGTSEKWKRWLNRIKIGIEKRMTDRKHIKKIIEIKLIGIKTEDSGRIATLNAKFATTSQFSSRTTREADGSFVASYHWILRQKKDKGPWYFDGGGF